jgi:tRNA uridine 5-carboxymethylaminomethyl modification enzyme
VDASLRERFLRYSEALERRRGGEPAGFSDEELAPWSSAKLEAELGIERRYSGYLEREAALIARRSELESVAIPEKIDYAGVAALPIEARQKLSRVRPATLGQASRVPGVTPTDVQLLWVHVERLRREAPLN